VFLTRGQYRPKRKEGGIPHTPPEGKRERTTAKKRITSYEGASSVSEREKKDRDCQKVLREIERPPSCPKKEEPGSRCQAKKKKKTVTSYESSCPKEGKDSSFFDEKGGRGPFFSSLIACYPGGACMRQLYRPGEGRGRGEGT